MSLHIEYETDLSLDIPVEDIICNVVDTALDFYECPYEAEVNVILTDNPSIASINEEHRGLAKSTDVLSFPMLDYDIPGEALTDAKFAKMISRLLMNYRKKNALIRIVVNSY